MRNDRALELFEKRGKTAGALMAFGNPESTANGEKRIEEALRIYYAHPHLQEKMHVIARAFDWNFVAKLEQKEYMHQTDRQRGARL